LRFTVYSIRHLVNTHTSAALQRIFQALYLLHKALHSGRRHVTFCCSKQLNHTFLLSRLTRSRKWSGSRHIHMLTYLLASDLHRRIWLIGTKYCYSATFCISRVLRPWAVCAACRCFHMVGKWVPALAGKEKAGVVHSVSRWTCCVQVKLRSFENACHTWAP